MGRGLRLLVLSVLPMSAAAQSDARLGAGVGVTFFESTGKARLSPAFRGRRSGFGATLGFNWHTTGVAIESKGLMVRADLRVRPVMVGPSYSFIRGRLATTAAVVGGQSFNRIASTGPTAGPFVELRVEKSLAWAPTVTLAFDLSRNVGLVATASYLVTRPHVTIRSDGVEDRSRFRADTLIVQVGVVFGLF